MSYENRGKTITLLAAADVTDRYLAVKTTSTAETFAVCGAGEAAVGILQDPVKAGMAGAVMINGVSFIEAAGAIAAGAAVASNAAGKGVAAVDEAIPFGMALNAASAAGDIISVLLQPTGNPASAVIVLSYTSADLAAGGDLAGVVIGAAPFNGTLVGAKVISTGSAVGVDASNTSAFEVKVGSTTLASKTFNNTVAFPAAGVAADLTLGSDVTVTENDVIKLSVTNGDTADLPIFVVQLFLV